MSRQRNGKRAHAAIEDLTNDGSSSDSSTLEKDDERERDLNTEFFHDDTSNDAPSIASCEISSPSLSLRNRRVEALSSTDSDVSSCSSSPSGKNKHKRKRTHNSECWQYFENTSFNSAKCKICQFEVDRKGNTSNLWSHLEKKHYSVLAKLKGLFLFNSYSYSKSK